MVTVRRRLIRLLDRPGGRKILAVLGTWYARRLAGADTELFYDEGWVHRMGQDYIPDSFNFDYYLDTISNWESKRRSIIENVWDYWFHVYKPSSGDVIVDVGAGDGREMAVFSSSVGDCGKVFAVEAQPKTFYRLQKICEWNRLENVFLFHQAIVDTHRMVYIEDRPKHESNSIGFEPAITCLQKPVHAFSLDEFCRNNGIEHIDFLKMNIEGAERFAIRGMSDIIRKTRYVCIACHNFRCDECDQFRTKDEVVDFLRDNDFEVVIRANDPRPYVREHVHGVSPSRVDSG